MGIVARQSIKASIIAILGIFIGAFSRLFLYVKFLSPSEIGILETIIKLGMLLTPFVVFGSPQVITRFYHRFEKDDNDQGLIFTYVYAIFLIFIPLITLLYFLLDDYIFSLYEAAPELINYAVFPLLVGIAIACFNFFKSISVVKLRIVMPNFFSGFLDKFFIFILLLVYGYAGFLSYNQFLSINLLLFFALPLVLMILYVVFVIKPKVIFPNIERIKFILSKTLSYNFYLLFSSFSAIIIGAIDINMISGSLGTDSAGVYTIAFFMGTVIDVPRRNLTTIIYPILNTSIINENIAQVKSLYVRSSVNQALVGLFIFMCIFLNLDNIFQIIPNGEKFEGGKFVVIYIGLSKLIDMLMGVNKEIIELKDYYKFNLYNNVLLGILVVVLNLYFVTFDSFYFGGINGVAFASLLAIFLSNLFSFSVLWFKEKMHPFSKKHVYILLLFLISIAFHFISFSLNPYLDLIVNTAFVTLLFIFFTLYFKISEDFTNLFYNFFKPKN